MRDFLRWAAASTAIKSASLLACVELLLAVALAGCHDSASPASQAADAGSASPAQAMPSASALAGSVTIEQIEYSIWGWLTSDGTLRLNVSLPSAGIAVDEVIVHDPGAGVAQIVGRVAVSGTGAYGSGAVIGEGCSVPASFCSVLDTPQIALIVLTRKSTTDSGTGLIRITTSSGDEVWPLTLDHWGKNGFQVLGDSAIAPGLFGLQQPALAPSGSAVMNVNEQGWLFFQSAENGCTGNGTIEPLRGGDNGLYHVTLTIGNCTGASSYLNGDLEGLSDMYLSLPWDAAGSAIYEMLLSTAPGTGSSPVAIVVAATQH
jgi:hypothetical protein